MTQRRSCLAISSLVLACLGACASDSVSGGCVDNNSCSAGSICTDGGCAKLCTGDGECASGEICSQGLCGAGVRSGGPEITFIDGDGSDLPQPSDNRGSHASHRLRERFAVNGLNLEGTALTLVSDAGASVALTIESSSSGQIVAALPETASEGHYTLTATNGAGSDQVEVWLLRGEKGDPGEPQSASGVLTLLQSLGTPVPGLHAQTAASATTADTATTALSANTAATATTATTASALLDASNTPHPITDLALKSEGVPPGAVMHFASATCPNGWVAADGTTVSRASFPALFAIIGTTFGAGDGSTTFGKPDLRGEFIRSLDGGRGVDGGRALGSAQPYDFRTLRMTSGNTAAYQHSELAVPKDGNFTSPNGIYGGSWGVGSPNSLFYAWDTSEVRPRNVALLACIKT